MVNVELTLHPDFSIFHISKLIGGLKSKGIEINRKMLAELAARGIDGFKAGYKNS